MPADKPTAPIRYPARHAVVDRMQTAHRAKGEPVAVMIATWQRMATRLVPLVGPGGTQMILARSLRMVGATVTWLPVESGRDTIGILQQLTDSYAARDPAEAIAINDQLLETFVAVLCDLIGEGLAVQVLNEEFPSKEIHD